MFYGRAAGHDALFSLGLEYNEDDEWNLLRSGGQGGAISGAEDPQVVMFTVLHASKGEVLKVGKANEALANRAIISGPQETVPTNTSGPSVQRGRRGREPRNCNNRVLLR